MATASIVRSAIKLLTKPRQRIAHSMPHKIALLLGGQYEQQARREGVSVLGAKALEEGVETLTVALLVRLVPRPAAGIDGSKRPLESRDYGALREHGLHGLQEAVPCEETEHGGVKGWEQ